MISHEVFEGNQHFYTFGPIKLYVNGSIYSWILDIGRFSVSWEKKDA